MKFATPRQTAVQIFRVPLILAVISGAGLIYALVEEGSADVWSSIAIAFPLAAAAWGIARYRRHGRR